jgi:hypothetical protein
MLLCLTQFPRPRLKFARKEDRAGRVRTSTPIRVDLRKVHVRKRPDNGMTKGTVDLRFVAILYARRSARDRRGIFQITCLVFD